MKTLLEHIGSSLEDKTCVSNELEDLLEYSSRLNDALCNRIDTCISDRMYIHTSQTDPYQPQETHTSKQAATRNNGFVSFMTNSGGEKPQTRFIDTLDNSNTPFIPKYESLRNVEGVDVDDFRRMYTEALDSRKKPPHPMESILRAMSGIYSDEQLLPPAISCIKTPAAIEETELRYIDNLAELESIATVLHSENEIAVDLEAHNYRSFQGFCCLMQISTRTLDIIIDVIELRSDIGRLLGPVFANPKIVKVFHGSRSDLVWLQRDFGIYVCNLFDTGIASKTLNYESNGLAYLLEKHCGFKADKRWQLADWRIRPLQNEAIHYARADTHWLLYCYDILRIELSKIQLDAENEVSVNRNASPGIAHVLEQSTDLCYTLYEKELYTEKSFYELYQRMEKKSGVLTERQLSVFAAIYKWRDSIARELDESTGYILPRGQLFNLAVKCPTSKQALDQILKSKTKILMEKRDELLYVIDKALKDTSIAKKARLGELLDDMGATDRHDMDSPERSALSDKPVQVNNNLPLGLYSNLGVDIDSSVIGLKKMSSLGSMKKITSKQRVGTDFKPTVSTISLNANDSPQRIQHQSLAETPPQAKNYQEEEKEKEIPVQVSEQLPLGTLDGDFLPLPISKLKTGRKNRSSSKFDRVDNPGLQGHQKKMKKSVGPESPSAQQNNGEGVNRPSFDPEKALSKYSFGKKQRNTSRGRGRGRGRNSRKEEDYTIPTGMFNPLSGLLEGKSSSKRSATQVRSGNRSSTYRKR